MSELNKKFNIFLTNSPFQLISAIEAAHQFNCSNNILVIRYSSNKNNNDQVKSLIKKYNLWTKIYEIPYKHHEFVGFFHYLKIIKQLSHNNNINDVFIGEFRSFEMHLVYNNLNYKNVYLLDDGTITLKVQHELIKNIKDYSFESKWKLYFKIKVARLFKLNWTEIKVPHLFTSFKLKPVNETQLIIHNNFNFIKKHYNNEAKLLNEVHFIGSPSVEDNVVKDDVFFNLLSRINNFYLEKGLKMRYVSHRRENTNKLNRIEKLLKNSVLHYNKPVELVLLDSEELPQICCSFFSTALFTINSIFKHIEINSFRIPQTDISLKDKSRVKLFYENMNENNIMIIEDF